MQIVFLHVLVERAIRPVYNAAPPPPPNSTFPGGNAVSTPGKGRTLELSAARRSAADGAEGPSEGKDDGGRGRQGREVEGQEKHEAEEEEGGLAAIFNSRASAFISRSRAREEAVRFQTERIGWASLGARGTVGQTDSIGWIQGGPAE